MFDILLHSSNIAKQKKMGKELAVEENTSAAPMRSTARRVWQRKPKTLTNRCQGSDDKSSEEAGGGALLPG